MAPEFPPNVVIFDSYLEGRQLRGTVTYVESPHPEKALRVRWSAATKPDGFEPIGGGVAFVFGKPKDFLTIPASSDAQASPLGNGRYRWSEGIQFGNSLMLILILPKGYSVGAVEPAITDSKEFQGRIAVYWMLQEQRPGQAKVEFSLKRYLGPPAEELININQGSEPTGAQSHPAVEIDDAPRPERQLTVFISYSHTDERWLKLLQVHLRPLERRGKIVAWDDTRIKAGSRWREEIEDALSRAAVAVLLVSPHFLGSDFIQSNELPPLLEAAEHRGTLILPVIIRASRFEQTPALAQFQAVNPPSRPLAEMPPAKRDQVFVALSGRIEEAFQTPMRTTVHSTLGEASNDAALDLAAVNREVMIEGYVIRQLTSGTIHVIHGGQRVEPAKPVLRRFAKKLGISLSNTRGNPRNTRQLGSELIKVLGG
jgi:hypothetical protein